MEVQDWVVVSSWKESTSLAIDVGIIDPLEIPIYRFLDVMALGQQLPSSRITSEKSIWI